MWSVEEVLGRVENNGTSLVEFFLFFVSCGVNHFNFGDCVNHFNFGDSIVVHINIVVEIDHN